MCHANHGPQRSRSRLQTQYRHVVSTPTDNFLPPTLVCLYAIAPEAESLVIVPSWDLVIFNIAVLALSINIVATVIQYPDGNPRG